MNEYQWNFKGGITRTTTFEEKGLAQFAANCGIKCDHSCTYCSSGAMVRMHEVFKRLGLNPFENNYAIIDPNAPARIAHDARRKRKKGIVQLCTITDAWSPIAQLHNLSRQCLEAILFEPGWTVRILTKNAAVRKNFDLIEKYKDRVLVGLSVTATKDKQGVISVIEPNASPIDERMSVLQEAIKNIRKQQNWSEYVQKLIQNMQSSVRKSFDIEKLRFLLYPSRLSPKHLLQIQRDDAGVVWL